jgi:hypothetical protein
MRSNVSVEEIFTMIAWTIAIKHTNYISIHLFIVSSAGETVIKTFIVFRLIFLLVYIYLEKEISFKNLFIERKIIKQKVVFIFLIII